MPPRHKNSITETSGELDLSNTKDEQDNKVEPSGEEQNVNAYVSEQIYHGKKSPTTEKISGVEAVDGNGRKMHEYTSIAEFITRTILSILNFLSQLRTSVAIRHPSMTKTKVSVMYASMAL